VRFRTEACPEKAGGFFPGFLGDLFWLAWDFNSFFIWLKGIVLKCVFRFTHPSMHEPYQAISATGCIVKKFFQRLTLGERTQRLRPLRIGLRGALIEKFNGGLTRRHRRAWIPADSDSFIGLSLKTLMDPG